MSRKNKDRRKANREGKPIARCWVKGCPRELGSACACDPEGAVLVVNMLLHDDRIEDAKLLASEYDLRVVSGEDGYFRTRNLGTGKSRYGLDFGDSWKSGPVCRGATVDQLAERFELWLADLGYSVVNVTESVNKDSEAIERARTIGAKGGFTVAPRDSELLRYDDPRITSDGLLIADFSNGQDSAPPIALEGIFIVSRIEGHRIDLKQADGRTILAAVRQPVPGLSVGDSVKVVLSGNETAMGPNGEERHLIVALSKASAL